MLEEIPQPRYTMAQSTVVEPSPRQSAKTSIPASTSIATTTRRPPGGTLSSALTSVDIPLPLNPATEIPSPGPAVTSVINAPSTSHLDESIPRGDTLVPAEDETDIWREMVETFEDLYQGLAAEDTSTLAETNSMITYTPPDDNATNPGRTNEAGSQNRFEKPFQHGFHRVVHVDQQNNCTVSYIAPDRTTWIHSSEAMEQFLREDPTLDVLTPDFCWANLILGFKEPTWETVHVEDQRQRHSRTPSGSPSASPSESASDDQTPPSTYVNDVQYEQPGDNANNARRAREIPFPFPQPPGPHRLDNTLKPNRSLVRDMSITEADTWLRRFTVWFEWNAPILDTKDPITKRVLLENFIDERLRSKLRADTTITTNTPVLGTNGIIDRLRSYYNKSPIICRRHAFTTCKQVHGEPFLTWWERKMTKAQEAMIVAMTTENWLELELIQGISDPNLRKRILQECNPRLQDMIGIATRWQSAEDATAKFVVETETSETSSEQDEASEEVHIWNKGPVTSTIDCTRNPREEEEENTNGNQKSKNDTPTDTSISGDNGLVRRTGDYTTGKPLDQGPRMRNVRITPVANGYRQNFLQFSYDVHPDTGCMETVIARNMARRQKMSVTPVSRQLRRAKGRRWRGLTTFDIEYHGRTLRVEALLSASL